MAEQRQLRHRRSMASRRSVSIVRLLPAHHRLPPSASSTLSLTHSRRRASAVHTSSAHRGSMSSVARGCFIVLEGLDRSGKTTQCRLLAERLNRKQATVEERKEAVTAGAADSGGCVQLRFPDRSTAIGAMLDAYLRQAAELDDHAVHLLFAANRWERQQSIAAALASGQHVVVDRYSSSGAAFSAAKGVEPAFCWQSEVGLPAPDLTLFLSISAAEAEQRGGYGAERYENREMQERVRQQFARLRQQEKHRGRPWVEVEAGKGRTVEDVAHEIAQTAEETIRSLQSRQSPLQRLT